MGFVGGGGNNAIETAIPSSFSVLYCKHQIVHGISVSYFLCLPEASVSGNILTTELSMSSVLSVLEVLCCLY